MKLLRIKDNSQQKKDAFSQVARLTGKIADKTLEQLEREGVFVFPAVSYTHLFAGSLKSEIKWESHSLVRYLSGMQPRPI